MNKKNAKIILGIEYDGKKYVKVMKTEKNKITYEYYKVLEEGSAKSMQPVEDEELLEYFRSMYEIQDEMIID